MFVMPKKLIFYHLFLLSVLCGLRAQTTDWPVISYEDGEVNYIVIGNNNNFQIARDYCMSHNYQLIRITDVRTHQILKELLSDSNITFNGLWVGLTDEQKERVFKFTDGQTAPYLPELWLDGQPDNGANHIDNCARMKSSEFLLADFHCSKTEGAICEASLEKLLECKSGYTLFKSTCYKVFDNTKKFDEAKRVCENEGGMLVRVPDRELWEFLKQLISKDDKSYWIGMTDQAQEGTWLYINGTEVPQSFFDADLWEEGEPNDDNNQDCCEMDNNAEFKIMDLDCRQDIGFICETEVNERIACKPNGKNINETCYYLKTDETDFQNSEEFCQTEYNGHLARVPDIEILKTLKKLIEEKKQTDKSFWIGLTDEETEGQWKYIDGGQAEFVPELWGNVEPNDGGSTNEDCVIIDDQNQMKLRDTECSSKHSFICQELRVFSEEGCPFEYRFFNGKCYKVFDDDTKIFHESKMFCKEEGGMLAKVVSYDIWQFLYYSIKDRSKSYWVGITDLQQEGVWRYVDGDLMKNSLKSANVWWPYQPDYIYPDGDCAAMDRLLSFRLCDRGCEEKYGFICERALNKEGWPITSYQDGNTYYRAIGKDDNFTTALAHCEEHEFQLVKITDAQTYQALQALISSFNEEYKALWIGMTDEEKENNFKDIDNKAVPNLPEIWLDGEPDNGGTHIENCAILGGDPYLLADSICSRNCFAVCEAPQDSSNTCSNTGKQYQSKCYYLNTNKTNFWKSNRSCETQYNGNLANIANAGILASLQTLIEERGLKGEDFWVGYTDEQKEGDWKHVDGSKMDFIPELWHLREPDDGGINDQDCVVIDDQNQMKLKDTECSSKYNFICQEFRVLSAEGCPERYDLFNTSCYRAFPDLQKNFTEAMLFCEEEGGKLVKIASYEIWEYLRTEIQGTGQAFWVGMSDRSEESVWRFIDSELVPTSFETLGMWSDGNLSNYRDMENCAEISQIHNYRLNDNRCSNGFGVICEIDMIEGCISDIDVNDDMLTP
ncbi:macrophage mannose receptor 1-like [Tachypleus tridentatus]|uniref:macrophage mannose receptor 1-like n=1 Tax=Tachypleus tridentatus TaxID=6853 RepID=UPI003FD43D85